MQKRRNPFGRGRVFTEWRVVAWGVQEAPWDWEGGEAGKTSQSLAKTMRNPSEALANNTRLAPGLRAADRPVTGGVVAGSAEAAGVRHSRKEGADTNVPAWWINKAQHSLAGTNSPDEPYFAFPCGNSV
jgi:hypothetical protein